MKEDLQVFEKRKQEHIQWALDDATQNLSSSQWETYQLQNEAFPEINFKEVDSSTSFFSRKLSSPLFISSMTAGHANGEVINSRLAALSARKQILMGVGSQRKELSDASAGSEWKKIRSQNPQALLMGNVGLTQVITESPDKIQKLVDSLEAVALIVHTNPLQEVLQKEGTPNFRGGLQALENLVKKISVPVVVKEVGFGFSSKSFKRLNETGIAALDLSGKGGTHWGRLEGLRSENQLLNSASMTFQHWGRTTLEMLKETEGQNYTYKIWASGGVRSGLDAAKCVSLGASLVGLAQPWLQAALNSDEALDQIFERLQFELKTALFCTGHGNLASFQSGKVGVWQKA